MYTCEVRVGNRKATGAATKKKAAEAAAARAFAQACGLVPKAEQGRNLSKRACDMPGKQALYRLAKASRALPMPQGCLTAREFQEAFTHISYEMDNPGYSSNAVLSIIGSCVLNMLCTDYIEHELDVGKVAPGKVRTALTQEVALARTAPPELLPAVRASRSLFNEEHVNTDTIKVSVIKSIMAALWVKYSSTKDVKYADAARDFAYATFERAIPFAVPSYRSLLQEVVQKYSLDYKTSVSQRHGSPMHKPTYCATVYVIGSKLLIRATGVGNSKLHAIGVADKDALLQITTRYPKNKFIAGIREQMWLSDIQKKESIPPVLAVGMQQKETSSDKSANESDAIHAADGSRELVVIPTSSSDVEVGQDRYQELEPSKPILDAHGIGRGESRDVATNAAVAKGAVTCQRNGHQNNPSTSRHVRLGTSTGKVHTDRDSIIEYIGKELLEDEAVSLDFLHTLYDDYLGDHSIRDIRGFIFTEPSLRAFLRKSDKFLAPRDASIRYYDMAGRDFAPLIAAIDPEGHDGLEYSAGYFWKALPDVMEEYDLRSADELHALLRKLSQIRDIEGLAIGHVPMIGFGSFDRRQQVLALMREMTPVSGADLAAEYERRYGVLARVVLVWLKDFALYRSNGLYSADSVELTDEQRDFLRKATEGECTDASYVRLQFRARFPHSSSFAVSDEGLRSVGRFESGGLVFHEGTEPRAYFRNLLASHQSFGVGTAGFGEAMFANSDFKAELEVRKRAGDLLETARDTYVALGRLQASTGITPQQVNDYADEVCSAVPRGAPFTVASLSRVYDFVSPLDVLRDEFGVEDCLYENLLAVDRRIKSGSLAGVSVFCVRSLPFTGPAFLELLVGQLGPIDLLDLADVLVRDYGIEMTPVALRSAIERSGLYYNHELDRAYSGRDAYRMEAEEWISLSME